jgi:hypothetical protein
MIGISGFLFLLYASIALSSLYAAWKSYSSDTVLFKKGIGDTSLESSKILLSLQVAYLTLLALVMIVFLWVFSVHRLA